MKFLHPDNADKKWVDWRLPENRKELFFRWFNWRLLGKNIDHYAWNLAYMNTKKSPTGKPMTRKQKLWYSYLFGTTYQSSMAWTFYWHFQDPMAINMADLDKWNRETMPRQKFATDTRYNKGHVVKMWSSFIQWVEKEGKGDIEAAFDKFIEDDQNKSYHNITAQIRSWEKFGRMTSWIAAQCLYECAKLPIEPDTMHIEDTGNVSVWNGMCYLMGIENLTVGDQPKFAGYKPTAADRTRFLAFEKDLMAQAKEAVQNREFLSYFTLETHLCQFKKLNVGYDYPGQNVGDAVTRYYEFSNAWPEVDYSAFADAVNSSNMFENIRWHRESKALFPLFKGTGQPINMDNIYPDLPNMSKELDLKREMLIQPGREGEVERLVQNLLDKKEEKIDAMSMFG